MNRRRILLVLAVAAGLVALVPVVAFGVIPLFVRSTANEARPAAVAVQQPDAGPSSPALTAAPTQTTILLSGTLRKVDPVHYGSGQVSILDTGAGRVLRFENVDIAGAPNMFVYLSERSDGQPGTFTDLGPLKATNGSFNYELPAAVDLAGVHSVVVWCRAFTVTVTYALLAAR